MQLHQISSEIADQLAAEGYCVWPDFQTPHAARDLLSDLVSRRNQGLFKDAKVGRALSEHANPDVRRDQISWFNPTELSSTERSFWNDLTRLKEALNQTLFLGLWELEGHFSIYPSQGFYRRHRDRFLDQDTRTVTLVFYLNVAWKPSHGGELVIFHKNKELLVEPRLGTLVCFLSDQIEHEVRVTDVERFSFAGWMKRRS